MLGVTTNPTMTPSDDVMKQVADEMGAGETFRLYAGRGLLRRLRARRQHGRRPVLRWRRTGTQDGCIECGECMTGCRHNAKNTLPKNYLHLAEQAGALVHPLTTVTEVRPLPGGGYAIATRPTAARSRRARSAGRTFTAEQVIFAASALGTQRLLHRMRDEAVLPGLSPRLGYLTRTNSESILGAIAPDLSADFSRGVAITSSFHPDADTHIEPVRYGKGSNSMSLLQTVLTDDDGGVARWRTWLAELWREKRSVRRLYDVKHWSERTVIALVMQTVDNSITTYTKRSRLTGRRRLTSRQGHGIPNPTWIPVANDAVRRMARIVNGTPGGSIGEPFNRPMTAHFIGGCTIGDSPETGVVDGYQRVYGYPRAARDRRLRDLGQPRGQPVAHDHGPGRTRCRSVAEQGGGRRPPGTRGGVPTARAGRAEEPGRPGACARGTPPAHRRNPLTERLWRRSPTLHAGLGLPSLH